MPITFHTADIQFTLKQKKKLKHFITAQIKAAQYQPGTLSFVFCSDDYLLDINRQFLKHDYYTDIITFPLNEFPELIEGEVYISIDRVKENAEKYRKASAGKFAHPLPYASLVFNTELHRVIFHGVLHLLGYKDKSALQQAEMRKMEDRWLRKYEKEEN